MSGITEKLSEPLTIDQVDFRIQSINRGGYATILAYKDARVDMHRLNSVLGVGAWQKHFEEIAGNLFCSVGIYTENGWAWVQDVGIESNTEKEKGRASDAFKRACFNLGIGIELYDYPEITVKLNDGEWEMRAGRDGKERPSATWNLKLKDWSWYSEFTDRKISFLAAKDGNGKMRFQWGKRHGK